MDPLSDGVRRRDARRRRVRCVNIEAWHVAAGVDLTSVAWVGDDLPDADVVGNTELELTPTEARRVARLLVEAAERADGGPSA